MRKPLGTFTAIVVALLAIASPAPAAEQTREAYKAQIEPICETNRSANERIMDGARERINRDELGSAAKQFIQVSGSFGGLIKRLAAIPAPPADEHRVDRWFEQMRLLKTRLRNVGKYYKEGLEIKATHESILAERSGIAANNISIVFKVRYCRFGRIKGS
jgi:hypothetical protein